MDVHSLDKWLAKREISTHALAKEIGVDRQKLDYWLDNDSEVYAYVDRGTGEITKITGSTTKVLYKRQS